MSSIKELNEVHDMLCDDVSKMVYLNKAAYEITGNYLYLRNIINHCYPQLRCPDGRKNIIIYGAGIYGENIEFSLSSGATIPIKCFWDRNHAAYTEGLHGKPVYPIGTGLDPSSDQVVIASTNKSSIYEMRHELLSFPIPEENILEAKDFFAPHKYQYFDGDIISFNEKEVFLDCGSFDFGNSKFLLSRCDTVNAIYAFEPIVSDLLKNEIKTCHFNGVHLFEAAVWNENGETNFIVAGGGSTEGSYVASNGNVMVKTVKLDDVINIDDKVTFIKMDIEGSELMALKGAERIITRDKPKLAISIYHKPEDLTEIPLLIKSMVPEYKLYVRHYSIVKWETVLYAV